MISLLKSFCQPLGFQAFTWLVVAVAIAVHDFGSRAGGRRRWPTIVSSAFICFLQRYFVQHICPCSVVAREAIVH